MRGQVTKYLFIDSNANDGKVVLPPQPFSVVDNESMSLTLISFALRNTLHQINSSNNTFYVYITEDLKFYEIIIPSGDYDAFDDLKTEINNQLAQAITNAASTDWLKLNVTSIIATFSKATRSFTFTITMIGTASPTSVQIRAYNIKDGYVPPGISKQGAFSDSFEILGCNPLVSDTNQNSLKRDPSNSSILTSQFPASLSTLDQIFLRLNLELGNYESPGLDIKHVALHEMQNSSIIARFNVNSAPTLIRQAHDLITFEDQNDTYQKFLPQRNLQHLHFSVTDKRNRLLSDYDPNLHDMGSISFNLTLRWDKFVPEKVERPISEGFPPHAFPHSYGYNMPRIGCGIHTDYR